MEEAPIHTLRPKRPATPTPFSKCPKCAERAVTVGPPGESGKRRAECSACAYKFKIVPTEK